MMNTKIIWSLLSVLCLTIVACKKGVKNPDNNADHDAITTVVLNFKQNGNTVATFTFDDPDGIGGNNPIKFDTIRLNANTTYNVSVTFLNKLVIPIKDMTLEIKNAGIEHEVFYTPTNANITITKTDRDANNYPLGLESTWVTSATTTTNGKLNFRLKHKPFIKGPNDTVDKGHDDINIDFELRIQ